jgi:hypothetical protein
VIFGNFGVSGNVSLISVITVDQLQAFGSVTGLGL